MTLLKIPAQKTGDFSLKEQRVTWTKNTRDLEKILGERFAEFTALHTELSQKPRRNLKKTKELFETFPTVPEVALLHAYALIINRKTKKADRVIEEAHKSHPDHLLLKINYGDQLLRTKKLDDLSALFSHKTDLKDLYPEKRAFYIAEFRGFMTLMGHFHLQKGEQEMAICYHYLASKVDPDHPSTRFLGKKIYNNKKLFSK